MGRKRRKRRRGGRARDQATQDQATQDQADASSLAGETNAESAPTSASPEPPREPRRWGLELSGLGLLFLAVLGFLALKAYTLHYYLGDENTYVYIASVAFEQGLLPYRDVFYPRPPLQLPPGALVFALFGVSAATVRLLPLLFTLGTAGLLYGLGRRTHGPLAGGLAALLFLSGGTVFSDSTYWLGIHQATCLMTAGLWALLVRRSALAGVLLGLAAGTGTQLLGAGLMVGGLAALRARRDGLRYAAGLLGTLALVHGAGLLLAGNDYIEQVFRYHTRKEPVPGASTAVLLRAWLHALPMWGLAALGLALSFADDRLSQASGAASLPAPACRTDEATDPSPAARAWRGLRRLLLDDPVRGLPRIAALWALGYVIFIGRLTQPYAYYVIPMIPPVALAGGYAGARVAAHAQALLVQASWTPRRRRLAWALGAGLLALAGACLARDRPFALLPLGAGLGLLFALWIDPPAPDAPRAPRRAVAALAAILLGAAATLAAHAPLMRRFLPADIPAQSVTLPWRDAPLPGFLNGLVRRTLWIASFEVGRVYQPIPLVLFALRADYDEAREAADFVRRRTRPEQTVFGDPEVAPLVALLAGRRLAAGFEFTNWARFVNRVTTPEEAIARVDGPSLGCVVMRRSRLHDGQVQYDVLGLPAFAAWRKQRLEEAHAVHDPIHGEVVLLLPKPRSKGNSSGSDD